MNYDCLIVGGGISGLTCGIRCASEGLTCAIISAGMSALHFSSGSIDLWGYCPKREVVYTPFPYIENMIREDRDHPYAKCGTDTIKEAMSFFKEEVEKGGLDLYNNGEENHFHVTTMGTLKPTFFSQRSVFNEEIREAFRKKSPIAILNFQGFRDFYAELAVSNLKKNSLFRDIDIITGTIVLPNYDKLEKNPYEFRSIDIAKMFDSEKYLKNVAYQIKQAAGNSVFASLPAFSGITNFKRNHQRLEELTGLLIYEVPTLPPSILGMRIDNALKTRFAALGGVFIAGDRVSGGMREGGLLDHIRTENYGDMSLRAKYYVLSTGSFFSGGLVSEAGGIREPLFDLSVHAGRERNKWYSPSFFDAASHPFLDFGVITDRELHPCDREGSPVENLFCTGAMLAKYNPIREGSGGGVAISTGFFAAKKIIAGCKGSA